METIQVNDFLVSQWGYDQTNITFFKVLKRTATTLMLEEWEQKIVPNKDAGYLAEYVMLGDSKRTGQNSIVNYKEFAPFRRKIKVAQKEKWQDGSIVEWEYVQIKSWGMYAFKADPNKEYLQTHYH
jgi:hypothetical protein